MPLWAADQGRVVLSEKVKKRNDSKYPQLPIPTFIRLVPAGDSRVLDYSACRVLCHAANRQPPFCRA